MCIIGSVPNPEMAVAVVAWVYAPAEEHEETHRQCFETGLDGPQGRSAS